MSNSTEQLEYYVDRCKRLETLVNELATKLWGTDIHLAKKVSEIMDELPPGEVRKDPFTDEPVVEKEKPLPVTGKPGKVDINDL